MAALQSSTDYASNIETPEIIMSYDELKASLIKDFTSGMTLEEVHQKYEPHEKVASLIVKEFPLLGSEYDSELMELYGLSLPQLTDMKSTAIEKLTLLLLECDVLMPEIMAFLEDKDGMAFFQESSIVNRRDVASKGFDVDFERIIQMIDSKWQDIKPKEIEIEINVSNLNFDKEMKALDAEHILPATVRKEDIDELVGRTMPKMKAYFDIIKDKYSKGIGDLRHPLNDFQGTFVDRYENHLREHTKDIFTNLPSLFLSFLSGSPVMKHYGDCVSLHYDATKDMIEGKIKHLTLRILNPQNKELGISSLVENGLFFKLRTCNNIVASQIRGMHRYVPLQETGIPAQPSASSFSPRLPPLPPAKKKGGAKADYKYPPFFDLYQGQLLKSSVSNQEFTPLYPPIPVSKDELAFTKLEMEHIIGVYQASLLFKNKCYAMTIFANLQMMSHESNNGVASTPYIEQKLAFMIAHRDTTDAVSERSITPRLHYLLARLRAMEGCLLDKPDEMYDRYVPFSSYKPGLEKMIACLTHGKAFHVIQASQMDRMVELQYKTKSFVRQIQTVCHDLMDIQNARVAVRRDILVKFMIDKLLHIASVAKTPYNEDMVRTLHETPMNPADEYTDFFSKCDELTRFKETVFVTYCKKLSKSIHSLCLLLDIDLAVAISDFTLADLFRKANEITPENIRSSAILVIEVIDLTLEQVYQISDPSIVYRAILFSLLPDSYLESDLSDQGWVFFTKGVNKVLGYDEPAAEEPTPPPSLKSVVRMPVLKSSMLSQLRENIPVARTLVAGQIGKFSPKLQGALYKNIASLAIIKDNLDQYLPFFDEDKQRFIAEEFRMLQEKKEQDRLEMERIGRDASHVGVLTAMFATDAFGEVDPTAAAIARGEPVKGGGPTDLYVEECYSYDEKERHFNESHDEETYDYLCKSWCFLPEEKPMTDEPFMSPSMIKFIVPKVIGFMEKKENDLLNQIYLNHYDREDIPILQRLLRMIYDYFTLQGIYVPLIRDERPLYSFDRLLRQCLEKKLEYLSYPECDEMVFDNAYANILCIQIFGQPLTILINDLSKGKLPVPYGIQNHLCGDPFHPETFYVTFHVLKTILLTLPKCVSLATYLSYLNLLLGESFLHNMYTDASFSLNSRMHDSFFDKIIELQDQIDKSGPGMFTITALPDFLEVVDVDPEADVPNQSNIDVPKTDYPVDKRFSDQPGVPAAAGGTRRYRKKTKRQTLNKRFKRHRTRRLHGLYIRE